MVHSPVLTLQDVAVQRGEFVLCSGVNLTLKAGQICHLIGENGLGKTTLLHQIAGLLPTLQGSITMSARPVYISHQLGISTALSVAQNLRFLVALYGKTLNDDELDTALGHVGLWGLADTPSAELSAGQTRRIGLARLFVLSAKESPFWLLDEPLTALDKAMIKALEQQMVTFAAAGGAILTTSHQSLAGADTLLDLAEFAL